MEEIKSLTNAQAYVPSDTEIVAIRKVLNAFTTGRGVLQKNYGQFNGRNLYDCIDDWTKRWNSWIPPESVLDETAKSRIFLSLTRNAIIKYLSNVASNPPKAKITAINKKHGTNNKAFAQFLSDLKTASERNENYESTFLKISLEAATKGTAIVYEGYLKQEQKTKIPVSFDSATGKIKYEEGWRTTFDDCYARLVPVEDFYITNAYQQDVHKQPKIIWKEITTFSEAKREFGHYANFKYVGEGGYTVAPEPTTFYRNQLQNEVGNNNVEILRFYEEMENSHVVLINGVVIYNGPIPFKDGKVPFAKVIYEPFGNDFFWGAGYPHKIQGDQDMINTSWNLMVDKLYASSQVFGLSSDLDDLIDDEILQTNRIRKVGDINKWKFDTLPGVTAGEQQMLQMALGMAREFSGTEGGGNLSTPRGGKVSSRQLLLKQQELMKVLNFSGSFLEDFEEERTKLRISHILQFYSIPKIQKITGKDKKEQQQLIFRDINLSDVKLSDGRQGTKIIKILGEDMSPDDKANMADQLSIIELMGEERGTPTEALAIHVDTFGDFNSSVRVEKYSSFERNQILDQASRQEYANWRIQLAQLGVPTDLQALATWVGESYDVDETMFTPQSGQGNQQMIQQGGEAPTGGRSPAQNLAPARTTALQQLTQ